MKPEQAIAIEELHTMNAEIRLRCCRYALMHTLNCRELNHLLRDLVIDLMTVAGHKIPLGLDLLTVPDEMVPGLNEAKTAIENEMKRRGFDL